ncbi:tetratricopeptide repeat protein [Gilliamella mensalis]|uniref:tetratricopeptide repeat protein n=1 Tax=Gilliamella mensalis TaxID=1908520 RepID=UPI000A147637|nr:tetratricopeptide repeat protein [Gilliamella mensalis]
MLKFLAKLSLVLCFSIAANADQQTLFDFYQEYQKATEQNDPQAQYHVGLMYADGSYAKKRQFKGIEDGFEQQPKAQSDYIKAKEWFEKAANQGHIAAQHSLALLYYNGQGTKQSYAKGIEWDIKAAKKGDAIAQYTLATLYYNGTGVKQNYFKAKQWFTKAAEQNYSDAKELLTVVTKKVNAIVAKQQAKKKQAINNDCGCG